MIRILKTSPRRYTSDGASFNTTVTVKLPSGTTEAEAIDHIDGLYYVACRCAHDCCGHWQRHAWTHLIRHAKRREWTAVIHAYQNV